jgi:hypothetical protein
MLRYSSRMHNSVVDTLCCVQQTGVYRIDGSNHIIVLSYPDVTSDLTTQCLSRQQADNTLGMGNHVLTATTAGISRPP